MQTNSEALDIQIDVLDARHLAAGRVVDQRDVANFDGDHAFALPR